MGEYGIFTSIEDTYEWICTNPEDQRGRNSIHWMAEYMPILNGVARECSHITEFGINQVVSTWAFLHARPEKLVSVDKDLHRNPVKHTKWTSNRWLDSAIQLAREEHIEFEVIEGDTTEIDIEPTDLLFIDTYHHYDHVKKELQRHKDKVSTYIIAHDTRLFAGIVPALTEELIDTGEFELATECTGSAGMNIYSRIKNIG